LVYPQRLPAVSGAAWTSQTYLAERIYTFRPGSANIGYNGDLRFIYCPSTIADFSYVKVEPEASPNSETIPILLLGDRNPVI
jgi:hypothetical protein